MGSIFLFSAIGAPMITVSPMTKLQSVRCKNGTHQIIKYRPSWLSSGFYRQKPNHAVALRNKLALNKSHDQMS